MKLFALLLPLVPGLWAANYEIDRAKSTANFTVKHLLVNDVRGTFNDVTGTVAYDPKDVGATKVSATIGVASINTNQAKRDTHLRSSDFFDVEKFPVMKFVSSKVTAGTGPGAFRLTGDLTMHGVSRTVTLDVTASGDNRATAKTVINRKDFGLTWNKLMEGGGLTVSEEVRIDLDLVFVKK